MNEPKSPRRARHAVTEAQEPAEVVIAEATPTDEATPTAQCNVPECNKEPEWRGLCPAHRQTHRGLMDPKAVAYRPEPVHTREGRPDA